MNLTIAKISSRDSVQVLLTLVFEDHALALPCFEPSEKLSVRLGGLQFTHQP